VSRGWGTDHEETYCICLKKPCLSAESGERDCPEAGALTAKKPTSCLFEETPVCLLT
jgi:hypothetical protein